MVEHRLPGKHVAFLVANQGTEQVELTDPWNAVLSQGARASLVAPAAGFAQLHHGLALGDRVAIDDVTERARAEDYDAVVLPGGVVGPDLLRRDAATVDFLMAMFEKGKPVAAVSAGSRPLIDGDLVGGRTVTSEPGIQTDLRNAGAIWVDEKVVVCRVGINVLITGRQPSDLGAFCATMTRAFSEPPLER